MTRTSHQYSLGRALVLTGERFDGRSHLRVAILAVACGFCGAQIGSACLTTEGHPLSAAHRARIRIATRKYNESARITGRERVTILVRATRERHVLVKDATLCGLTPNVRLATRRGLIRAALSREITCLACVTAFEARL